ncbi:MAG: DHH family phosphoesterase, partial [Candidatus Thermoplasmatota archaeon]|nr:DHH family phosphoesterase [Candidatus Thermoplasmatota archaeon]
MIESTNGLIRIISHYDGDGICSAGIISRAVSRCGKRFHTTMGSVLKEEEIEKIEGGFELLIVTDMGSSQASAISKKMIELGTRCIILDHHKVEDRSSEYSISDGGAVIEVNPRFHKVNGTSGCSGSTLTYLLAVTLDPDNVDLAVFSLAGSLADRQHVPEFTELNSGIMRLAIEKGYIRSKRGMPFSGRSIREALVTSNDPFIEGISSNEKAAEELLGQMNIDPGKRIEEIDDEKMKVLHSYLYVKLLKSGVSKATVHELFRDNFYSERYGPLQDLAYAIDGCGRFDKASLGFQVVWGSMKAFESALEDRFEYKKRIQEILVKRKEEGVFDMEHIQWFIIEEDTLSGTIGGLSHSYFFDHNKPMLALAKGDNGEMKVSSRGDRELTRKGLDLGAAMREAGKAAGGGGGGHDVAAGAHFREDQQDEFLDIVN